MTGINEKTYDILNSVIALVAKLGVPLVAAAWLLVLGAALFMVFVLRRHSLTGHWIAAVFAGSVSLAAHMVDFFGTLRTSPDLSFEANPIWCIVVDNLGLDLAKWYGFTGKLLLSVLSFEFFAYYLIQRDSLVPARASGFLSFWKDFGKGKNGGKTMTLSNIRNLSAFLFALIGPFCFYIAALNRITDEKLYLLLPSMPIMLVLYLLVLTLAYLLGNYWSLKRSSK